MEQNKLPKNIRQIGEKEDWIRVYMEDYVHTYIQRLRGLQESSAAGGILLGKRQRINGTMHLFIRGAAVAADPFWKKAGQTPGQLQAENSVYFPGLEICGFFLSSRQSGNSEVDLVRIFETHFSSEYQILFQIRDQEEELFSWSGHGLVRLAGYYVYYEKNEEMQSYIVREESLRIMEHNYGNHENRFDQENAPEDSVVFRRNDAGEASDSSGENAGHAGSVLWAGRRRKRKAENRGTGQPESAWEEGRKTGRTGSSWEEGRKTGRPGTAREEGRKTGQPGSARVQSSYAGQKGSGKTGTGDQTGEAGSRKKLQKGDVIVRLISAAGIFLLAFILFSDQIQFHQIDEAVDAGSAMISSIIKESEASESDAILAGADLGDIAANQEENGNAGTQETEAGSGLLSDQEGTDTGATGEENESAASEKNSGSDEESVQAVSSSYVFPLRYLVKKGDSLYAISEKYYGTADMIDAICEENNIADPSDLKYGTILILPARQSTD